MVQDTLFDILHATHLNARKTLFIWTDIHGRGQLQLVIIDLDNSLVPKQGWPII